MNANTFRPIIESQLTTTLGPSVKLGDLSLALFSGNLIAKDLSVGDDPDFNAVPFLTAKEARIGVLMWPLIFFRKVNLQSVQIKSPEIGTPEDPSIAADVGGIFQKKKKSIAAFFDKKK